jgi:hypothetical protein
MSCANWVQVAGTVSLADHAELFAGKVGLLSLLRLLGAPNIESLEDSTTGCG